MATKMVGRRLSMMRGEKVEKIRKTILMGFHQEENAFSSFPQEEVSAT